MKNIGNTGQHWILKPLRERFIEKVKKPLLPMACWIWTAGKDTSGYGSMYYKLGTRERAHRVSYEIFIGKIPTGLCVLHRCDTRNCVNPKHLFIGTRTDNNHDRDRKGRTSVGESRPNAKLSYKKSRQIKNMKKNGVPAKDIASKFGICECTVYKVVNNKSWRSE